jgi:hypothetical protein
LQALLSSVSHIALIAIKTLLSQRDCPTEDILFDLVSVVVPDMLECMLDEELHVLDNRLLELLIGSQPQDWLPSAICCLGVSQRNCCNGVAILGSITEICQLVQKLMPELHVVILVGQVVDVNLVLDRPERCEKRQQ